MHRFKQCLFAFACMLPACLFAQKQEMLIVANDTVAVFEQPDTNATVMSKLPKGCVVLLTDGAEDTPNWYKIEIANDSFSKITNGNYLDFITAYIPKSQILTEQQLPVATPSAINLEFRIATKYFDTETRERTSGYGLDNFTDTALVVTKMWVHWNSTKTPQDTILFNDLFTMTSEAGKFATEHKATIYTWNQFYYIKQSCADGAGAYDIIWVLKNGKVIQRIIDEI